MKPEDPTPPAPSREKTALCTVLSDPFVLGFCVLTHSLRRQHPDLDLPFIIIHHPELAPLSPSSREMVSSSYPDVRFHEADASLYQTVWDNRDGRLRTPHRLKSAFFALEAFSLSDFDRVIALDSDMVCTGDLNPLFTHPAAFAATRAIDYDAGVILDFFNTGVLVIGAPHLTGETYHSLLKHRISDEYETRMGKADQAILNDYFRKNYTPLDEAYNVTKRKFPDTEYACVEDLFGDHVRILHFVAEKPWELQAEDTASRYSKLEKFWAGQLQAAVGFDGLMAHFRMVHTVSQERERLLQRERRAYAREKEFRQIERSGRIDQKKARIKERKDRIKEGRALSNTADRVVSQLITQMEELTVPAASSSGLKRWFSGLIRSISKNRILARTTKAREAWSRHHGNFEAKLAALDEPKEDPKP